MFLLQIQPTNRVDKILDYATLQIALKVYPINKGQDFHGFKQRRRKSWNVYASIVYIRQLMSFGKESRTLGCVVYE